MKSTALDHEFVDTFPTPLQPGIVYVSIQFATVAHLCCCGCGQEVVTPLSPARWQLGFDGQSVSLRPSIGNWALPCRSHYWILNNTVRWAEDWSETKIARAIAADQRALEAVADLPSNARDRANAHADSDVASFDAVAPAPGWLIANELTEPVRVNFVVRAADDAGRG